MEMRDATTTAPSPGYATPYPGLVTTRQLGGSGGITVLRVVQSPGHYPDPPMPEHVLFMARGRSFRGSVDFGAGRIRAWFSDGDMLLAPAGAAADTEALNPGEAIGIAFPAERISHLIGAEALGELAQGAALLAWHHGHRFCGRCGAETRMRIGGYKRTCTGCGAEHFPRTDPVAIMLAVREDSCLLGRGPHFGPGMYSCLAGFIEPGETIEAAVRRETLEESGIRLGRVLYHASQPWPFPHTLMIGCFGEALNGDIAFDGRELEDCRWFARDEVRAMVEGRHPDGLGIPPAGAIASHLIRFWAEAAA